MKINPCFFHNLVPSFSSSWRKAGISASLAILIMGKLAYGATLGETNIKLSGTIVSLTCTIDVNDKNKSVDLGSWPTLQLKTAGDRSAPVMFAIHLTGCPAGSVSAVINGKGDVNDTSLLALNDNSTAKKVAIEIQDGNHKRIPLGQSGPQVAVDRQGDAKLLFYADYYIVADSPAAGSANSDAVFTINYE